MYRLILRCAVPVLFFSLGHAQTTAIAQTRPDHKAPIIDVHLHAMKLSSYIVSQSDKRWWPQDLKHPSSDAGVMRETLATMKRYNIVRAVTSEDHANVEEWRRADPDRIIPALTCACVDPEEQSSVRQWVREGNLKVLGEVVWQYHGLTPNDPRVEPVWQLVEALDLPLGIHMGLQPTGWTQTVNPEGRIRNGNPLLLEDALAKHPKTRVYVMHAGWPHVDAMVAMLYQYPELYVDLAWIDWYLPRDEFYGYLKRLVSAGFAKRIMFGSDQMIWPGAIGKAIERIDSAPFLSPSQKRDIFYNNAVRFFKLDVPGGITPK